MLHMILFFHNGHNLKTKLPLALESPMLVLTRVIRP